MIKNIKLNAAQISALMNNKHIETTQNEIIEINNEQITLYYNNNVYNLEEICIQFKEKDIENRHVIDFLQKLICDHLNFERSQVRFHSRDLYECKFDIRVSHLHTCSIIVCEKGVAETNTHALQDNNPINFPEKTENIGPYKKLGNSEYYFRWLEDLD